MHTGGAVEAAFDDQNLIADAGLEPVIRQVLVALARRAPLLRPVYGKAKQGASFGHAKVGGYQILRRGYNPLIATIATVQAAQQLVRILGVAVPVHRLV